MERRLAAVLYADVAGYSRLTGLDEDDTHRKLDAGLNLLTDLVTEHGGQKVHEAGDAILAEFTSVTAAVVAAIEFQRRMSAHNDEQNDHDRLEFRVGVHLGEVIHDRNDIYGDGVNLAARIQEIADPGGLCISASVYEQVMRKVDVAFDDIGHHQLKNIFQSIHVYRARFSDTPSDVTNDPLFDFDSDAIDRSSLVTGGCGCGQVRFEISQPSLGQGFCHCRTCQRFIGAPVVGWVSFPMEAVRFTEGEPTYYESSLICRRGFCGRCGSSLFARYYAPDEPPYLVVAVASLDHPERFAPTWHGGTETQMPWLDIHDDLPRKKTRDSIELKRRWSAVGLPNPEDWNPY